MAIFRSVSRATTSARAERRPGPDGDREAEPARVGAGRRLGQEEDVGEVGQPLMQPAEVPPARLDEARELAELRHADGRLHVGELQVVADVRVDVLVVVAVGQLAELPVEALAAGVVGAGAHQQSRPQSRNDSASFFRSGLSVSTAPPSPIVMWWAG